MSEYQPLVTVVTPCRNAAAWLPACLDSVRDQTYPHVEHLVLDADSRDGTAALLAARTGLTWTSEPDDGQADALAKGFARARGSVLTWLNADDVLLPHAVEQVVEALNRSPRAGLVIGGANIVEAGTTRTAWPPARPSVRDLDRANPFPQPSCFFTRAAYDSAGGVDPDLHLTMDLDLWLRMLRTGVQVTVLDVVLSRIIVHPEAKTSYVPAGAWFREFGMARLKNERLLAAAISFGRSSAHAAAAERGVEQVPLLSEVRRWRREYPRLPWRGLVAGAYAEALVLEVRNGAWPRHGWPPLSLLTQETASELGRRLLAFFRHDQSRRARASRKRT